MIIQSNTCPEGKPDGRQKARNQPTGLVTPLTEEGPCASELGVSGHQPRAQRQGRTRKCNLDDEPVEKMADPDDVISARGRSRRREVVAGDDAVAGDEEGAEYGERSKKRRAGVLPPDMPEDGRQQVRGRCAASATVLQCTLCP
jgi:hypothetical protein